MESPLADIRVLDLSRVLSGPFAGRMLADLGAEVVKVEPPEGDLTRLWGDVRHGVSGFFTQQNAGKRLTCIDLKKPGGSDLVLRLATRADVLIENFRPGVLARLGLGWDRLRTSNPRLVVLSITGFGQESPDAQRQAYAPVVHAEAGLLARQAASWAHPTVDVTLSVADTNAGLHGLVAILAALHLRDRTGEGNRIDMSMLDAMLATDDYAHYALDGVPFVRMGGEVWDAPGGPVLIAGDFRYIWHQLHTRHGIVDPTPEGASLPEKIGYRRDAVGAWFMSFHDREECTAALEKANIAWGAVREPSDAFATPTAVSRGVAGDVPDGGGGTRRVVQSPYRFSNAQSGVRGPAGGRGRDNAAVMRDWLGLREAEITALIEAAVLQADE